jgi:DNA-binding beta-propeller fold protein YncE
MKKIAAWCITLALTLALPAGAAGGARSTSHTYAWDVTGALQISQDAYRPAGRMMDLGIFGAQDLFVLGHMLYIADTGNRRGLAVNLETEEVLEIGVGLLDTPRGISADPPGRIYVAAKERAYRFSPQGDLEFTFQKPTTPNFGANEKFNPVKIAPGDGGGVYIISEGTTAGIIHISGEGEFLGYFASNNVDMSTVQKIMNAVLTEDQKARFLKIRPSSYGQIFRGADGLIYTANRGDNVSIKKHAISGLDLFAGRAVGMNLRGVGDICVAEDGRMFAVESASGLIVEIQNDSYVLCVFGGTAGTAGGSDREGLFASASGIGVDGQGALYVLDETRNFIQVFAPSANQQKLYAAIHAYEGGAYLEARDILEDLVKFNNTALLPHVYMGRCYSQLGDYAAAARHFKAGGMMKSYYSDAYWEQRNIWLQNNLGWVLGAVLLLLAARWALKALDRWRGIFKSARSWKAAAGRVKLLRDVAALKFALLHPIDNAYNLKHGLTGSYGAGLIAFGLLLCWFVLAQVGVGFIFSVPIKEFSAARAFGYFSVALGLFVVLHTLIAAIRDGGGTLRDVFLCVGYGFAPVILFFPFFIAAANVLTLNERFILDIGQAALIGWSLVNIVAGLIEVHEYTLGQMVAALLLTLFFMVVAVLAGSVLYVMLKQIYDFVVEIVTEVGLRV